MKKVLILAYDFPPYISVGGLRPKAWLDYLKEFDVEPVVITRQWTQKHGDERDYVAASESPDCLIEKLINGTVIRTPYKPNLSNRLLLKYGTHRFRIIRKLISAYFEFFQFIFPIGPKAEIYKAAKQYLAKNQVDCLLATGDPFVLFRYAQKLSKKHGIPWIADYRDAWSTIFERQNKPMEKAWNTYFEKKVIPSAMHITTVSPFVQAKIASVVPDKQYTIIPNGFDPNAILEIESIQQKSDVLRIAMIGSIMPWNPMDHFLSTLSNFVKTRENPNFEFVFFGINDPSSHLEKVKKNFPEIIPYLRFTEKMENSLLLKKVAECNALLLFNYYSFMGTKIYDYLGLKRKIVLCFTDDPVANQLKKETFPIEESKKFSPQLQADLIHETQSGIAVKDAVELQEVLKNLIDEFQKNGRIACESKGIEKYSRRDQTGILAKLIQSISANQPN